MSASSGPEAAAAAVALAAQQQDPESEGTQGQPAGASSAEVAQQQQKDAEALNIIRVLYAADVPGLKRKRGAAAHNQQHKVGAGLGGWVRTPSNQLHPCSACQKRAMCAGMLLVPGDTMPGTC